MGEIVGINEMITLLNGVPVIIQPPISVEPSADMLGNMEWIITKPNSNPVVPLDKGQITIQLASGQQYILNVLNGLGEDLFIPNVIEDDNVQIASTLIQSQLTNMPNAMFKPIIHENRIAKQTVKTKNDKTTLLYGRESQKTKNFKEKIDSYVYLCIQCSGAFASLDLCRDHMIKDHHMILQTDTEEDSTIEEVTVDESPQIRLPSLPVNFVNIEELNVESENIIEKKSSQKISNKVQFSKIDRDFDVRPFRCKFSSCLYKFRSNESLSLHVACHNELNTKYYSCSYCEQVFNKWGPCALHLWNSHTIDVDLFTCYICSTYKTTTNKKLEDHLRIHRDVREFLCPICGKKFKQKTQMRNHQVSTHKDRNTNDKPRWYMSKKCEICFKTYADSKCLKKHIQAVHSKLKPYVCHVCGHSSARKAMWKSHVRQHTGEKPYKCTKCIFKTGDHNSLRRHMMRHSGVRPYQCPHCSYKSIQSSCYKNHISSRHPGKEGIFACKECSFTTVSQDSFVQHLLDHKNNLIACTKTAERSTEVEVFPENIAAAQLVYQCLGAVPTRLQSDVTASSTSSDGTKQTITIEIPPREIQSTDDEDTTHCFLLSEEYDTGGITIPAETESSMVCF